MMMMVITIMKMTSQESEQPLLWVVLLLWVLVLLRVLPLLLLRVLPLLMSTGPLPLQISLFSICSRKAEVLCVTRCCVRWWPISTSVLTVRSSRHPLPF
jgi:hypothetical protein